MTAVAASFCDNECRFDSWDHEASAVHVAGRFVAARRRMLVRGAASLSIAHVRTAAHLETTSLL